MKMEILGIGYSMIYEIKKKKMRRKRPSCWVSEWEMHLQYSCIAVMKGMKSELLDITFFLDITDKALWQKGGVQRFKTSKDGWPGHGKGWDYI